MRSDIEAAILGMYDSIERAREVQAAAVYFVKSVFRV